MDQAANPKQLSEHLVNQAIKENHVNQKLEIFFYSTMVSLHKMPEGLWIELRVLPTRPLQDERNWGVRINFS